MAENASYRIAILQDDLPGFDQERVVHVQALLIKAGFKVTTLNTAQLSDPQAFNQSRFDLLMLTSSSVFPAEAIDNLVAFLEKGGDMSLLGARPFGHLVMRHANEWKDFEAMRAQLSSSQDLQTLPLFESIDPKDWKRQSSNPKASSKLTETRFRQDPAIRLDLNSVTHYDTFKASLKKPISDGHNVLVMWARALSPDTKQAALELRTNSGARWIATIDLQETWQPIVLRPGDFHYYEGGGEYTISPLRFSDVSRFSIGLAKDFADFKGEDHTLMLRVLGTTQSDVASDDKVQDFQCFTEYPSFEFRNAPKATTPTSALDWLTKPVSVSGSLDGTSAFVISRTGISQDYPVLTVNNRDQRPITAGTVLAHYTGRYKDSQWFVVGCSTNALYTNESWDELLIQVLTRFRKQAWLRDAEQRNAFADIKRMRDIVGVTHVGAVYHFTDKDVLNEGAEVIERLGTRTIKLWIPRPKLMYRFNHEWSDDLASMVDVLKTAEWQEALSRPFDTYYLEAFAMPRRLNVLDRGVDEEEEAWIIEQFEEVTRYLLTRYRGTGKTFVLQNWEGDWALRKAMDPAEEPTPERIEAMVDWMNARQEGVERARKAVGEDGVRVLHAIEANLVLQQMRDDRAGVVRDVLPRIRVDLASYSCYDTRGDAEAFRAALEYIAMHLPETSRTDLPNRVTIGEIGVPETEMGTSAVKRMLPEQVEITIAYGSPHLLYWGLYCNELRGDHRLPVKQNDHVNGFWLIKPDGSKAWAWEYLSSLLNSDSGQ
ncbi:MAG: hypothetical protein AAGD43_06440 [Pseudomonadota bacterium]